MVTFILLLEEDYFRFNIILKKELWGWKKWLSFGSSQHLSRKWCSLSNLVEKAMAPHSSTLAWKILWAEEPGRLQSMGSLRVGHDWATSLSRIGEGNGNPLQCSCLENPRDGGAWWAAVSGVAQSPTQLKRLSSSSRLSLNYLECIQITLTQREHVSIYCE